MPKLCVKTPLFANAIFRYIVKMSAKPKTTHQELCKLMANAKLDNPADLRVAFDKAMAALGSVLDKKELQTKIKK